MNDPLKKFEISSIARKTALLLQTTAKSTNTSLRPQAFLTV